MQAFHDAPFRCGDDARSLSSACAERSKEVRVRPGLTCHSKLGISQRPGLICRRRVSYDHAPVEPPILRRISWKSPVTAVRRSGSMAPGAAGRGRSEEVIVLDSLRRTDPEVAAALEAEVARQADTLVLIASENFASRAVLEAMGSVFTNKYAEGYPGRRYYGGCEHSDTVERLAIDRAKTIFGAEHANVQPHSGSQANMAVYVAALKPGDTILGMDLAHGGHLTHGHPLNFSGRYLKVVPYGVSRETELLDYDAMYRLARAHRPRMIVAGASAYARVIDYKRIRRIADAVGALVMADIAHVAGLIAAGVHPNPVPCADFVTTTTHKTLRGPRGAIIL